MNRKAYTRLKLFGKYIDLINNRKIGSHGLIQLIPLKNKCARLYLFENFAFDFTCEIDFLHAKCSNFT